MSVARIEEAFLLVERGEMSPAADVLERVIAAAPGYAPAYVLGAKVSETLHRWPQALALWQDAALLIPTLDVAREGVLRATRVIAALQALDARTAARAEAAPEAPGASARPEAPLSPPDPPAARMASAPETAPPMTPPPPPEAAPAIRLGASASAEEPPSGRFTFDDPPPPPAERSVSPPPAREAHPDEEWMPRRPLQGGAFDAPPPPPDVFAREDAAPPGEPEADDAFGGGLDLDALIDQLNTQGRIRPRPDLDKIPAPDLDDDIEDMVSETLARIYATQGQFDEAARIYELLAAQHPEQADVFTQKAAEMRGRAE